MKSFALIAALAGNLVNAHYVFSELAVNGQRVGKEYSYIRRNTNSYQPTFPTSLNSPSMRCNVGADRGGATQTLTVAAGSKINFPKVITHPGPVFIWMSKAPSNVSSYDGSGDWFKISATGLCGRDASVDNNWCAYMKSNNEATIPIKTPPGEYLVRVEHLGIHEGHKGRAQFYFECARVKVTGSGGGTPGPLVKIPGYISANSPSVAYDKWTKPVKPYQMPPPAVWNGQ